MLRLSRDAPATVEILLGSGASIITRIPTTIETEAALAAMRRHIAAMRDGQGSLSAYGLEMSPLAIDDLDLGFGVGSLVMLTELALMCFVSWQGVRVDDNEPAPLDRSHIAMLLRQPALYKLVLRVLTEPAQKAAAEGNGFAPSPNGGQAGAPPIVDIAGKQARPAQAGKKGLTARSARKSNTNR